MARPYFQQVGLPSGGGSTQAFLAASRNVSDGLATIGSSLTNLGTRRQARAAEQEARRAAQAQQQLELAAEGVQSEDELQALIGSIAAAGGENGFGFDAAGVLRDRRTDFLTNEGTRIDNAQGAAELVGLEQQNRKREVEVGQVERVDDAQRVYGEELTEITRLMDLGGQDNTLKAEALMGSLSARMAESHGADIADQVFARARGSQTRGDDARFGVGENARKLLGLDLDNQGKALTNEGRDLDNTIRRGTIQKNNYQFGRLLRQHGIDDREWQLGEDVKDVVQSLVVNAIDFEDARQIALSGELNDDQLTGVMTELARLEEAAPNLFQDYTTISDEIASSRATTNSVELEQANELVKNMTGYNPGLAYTPENNDNINIPATVAGISANMDAATEGLPRYRIYNRAQQIQEQLDQKVVHNLNDEIRERFPDINWNKEQHWLNRIRNIQNQPDVNLSDAEMLSLLTEAYEARGANAFGDWFDGSAIEFEFGPNLFPGGERADQPIPRTRTLRDLARNYKTLARGTTATELAELEQIRGRASTLEREIATAEQRRRTALSKGGDRALEISERERQKVIDKRDELVGIHRRFQTLAGGQPNEVQATVSTVLGSGTVQGTSTAPVQPGQLGQAETEDVVIDEGILGPVVNIGLGLMGINRVEEDEQ